MNCIIILNRTKILARILCQSARLRRVVHINFDAKKMVEAYREEDYSWFQINNTNSTTIKRYYFKEYWDSWIKAVPSNKLLFEDVKNYKS